MRLIKLSETGIAHYVVPMLIIAIAAITGTGYLVATNADSLTSYAATCSINNVPTQLSSTATMQPTITVTNTGTGNLAPHMISFVSTNDGPTTYFNEVGFGTIKPGKSATKPLVLDYSPSLVVNAPAGSAQVYSHSDLNYPGTKVFFQCYTNFTIN